MGQGSFYLLLGMQLFQRHLLKEEHSFFIKQLCTFVKNQLTITFIDRFPLMYVPTLLPGLCYLGSYSLTVILEIRRYNPTLFTSKLLELVSLPFGISFRISLLLSMEKSSWVLIWILLKLQISTGSTDILTILSLSVVEQVYILSFIQLVFLLQCFVVFRIQILHIFCQINTYLIFLCYCK